MIVAGFAERESTAAHCDCAAAGGSSCSGGRFDRAAEKSRQSESEARAGDNRCNLVRFPNPLAFGSDFPKSGGDPVYCNQHDIM